MKKPTVEHTLPITTIITDSIVGISTYYVDVSFNEKMDEASTPLVTHESVDDLSGSLQFNFLESTYTTDSTFRAFFDVLDDHIEVDSIDIQVLFGNDFAGNIQTPYTENYHDFHRYQESIYNKLQYKLKYSKYWRSN